MGHYFHLFANGDDAKDFITSIQDFRAAFNRFAVCAHRCQRVKILAFCIEESHPHCLIYSSDEECQQFKKLYESLTYSYIVANRGNKDGVVFELESAEVNDNNYLLNVAAYILVQPTKDGKQIMPYDYVWGTASMYFRPKGLPPVWCYASDWTLCKAEIMGSLTIREKRSLTHSRYVDLPENWLVCNGLILPTNYVDVLAFESIFKTFNCFRVFMSAGKQQLQQVADAMANVRGVSLPDIDARELSRQVALSLFGNVNIRSMSPFQRITLAKELRQKHRLSIRQISILSRLPEGEIRKYVK